MSVNTLVRLLRRWTLLSKYAFPFFGISLCGFLYAFTSFGRIGKVEALLFCISVFVYMVLGLRKEWAIDFAVFKGTDLQQARIRAYGGERVPPASFSLLGILMLVGKYIYVLLLGHMLFCHYNMAYKYPISFILFPVQLIAWQAYVGYSLWVLLKELRFDLRYFGWGMSPKVSTSYPDVGWFSVESWAAFSLVCYIPYLLAIVIRIGLGDIMTCRLENKTGRHYKVTPLISRGEMHVSEWEVLNAQRSAEDPAVLTHFNTFFTTQQNHAPVAPSLWASKQTDHILERNSLEFYVNRNDLDSAVNLSHPDFDAIIRDQRWGYATFWLLQDEQGDYYYAFADYAKKRNVLDANTKIRKAPAMLIEAKGRQDDLAGENTGIFIFWALLALPMWLVPFFYYRSLRQYLLTEQQDRAAYR